MQGATIKIFNETQFSGFQVVTCWRTERQTDKVKLPGTFRISMLQTGQNYLLPFFSVSSLNTHTTTLPPDMQTLIHQSQPLTDILLVITTAVFLTSVQLYGLTYYWQKPHHLQWHFSAGSLQVQYILLTSFFSSPLGFS